jgi:hypothetical protein
MSIETGTGWLLRADAVVSWTLALPGLIGPESVATLFGVEEPTCTFLVRLWSGLLFMFGCVAWEASRNLREKAALLKYIWIEKGIVAVTVLAGHLAGEAPPSLMALVMLTNLAWVPPLLYFDIALRRARANAGAVGATAE